jgi:alpha-1,3-rhamnosyltransferase
VEKAPKVSVLVPCYNHCQYVEQAILSIVRQTYQDFELIVIDDGSSDASPEILKRLSDEYGVTLIVQENQGLVRTLNRLISLASGEYITLCASDDFWPEVRLEEQVAALDSEPEVALVHGIPAIVDGEGSVVRDERFQEHQMLDGKSAFRDLAWRKKRFQTTTIMIRASVYSELGGYDEDIAVEDIDYMFRVARKYPIKAVGKVWNYYRKHGENWTMNGPGAKRLIACEQQVVRKLGLRWGTIFIFSGLPVWFQIARRSNLPSRFLYVLLLPFYFWNKTYLKQLAALCLHGKRKKPVIG